MHDDDDDHDFGDDDDDDDDHDFGDDDNHIAIVHAIILYI